ncbi:integrase [Rhizobium sp. CCGE 510]|nr:integrase [Rhizobium sp. CCGE 510]
MYRLEVIQKINDRRLSVVQATELLGLSRSQVHRLLQAYDRAGAAGLVSKKRSRPSNRRHSEEFRNAALDLIRERYLDFGPTLAREKLIELHQADQTVLRSARGHLAERRSKLSAGRNCRDCQSFCRRLRSLRRASPRRLSALPWPRPFARWQAAPWSHRRSIHRRR